MNRLSEKLKKLEELEKYEKRLIEMHENGVDGIEPSIMDCGIAIDNLKEQLPNKSSFGN